MPPGAAPEALFWDTGDPYNYLRIDRGKAQGHDYAIFGGADHKTGQTAQPQEHVQEVIRALQIALPQAEVETTWSGQVIESFDGLPFIGETSEKQFVATGFGGNGMTFGAVAARILRDLILKRPNPLSSTFDVHRVTLKRALNYLRENVDYPYFLVGDRLEKPESEGFRSIVPGEGKIVQISGKRLAAYRHPSGELEVVSAVCSHMGCIVHWNQVEKTWDCPCHGSRFKTNGDVMAGPAETGLEPADRT